MEKEGYASTTAVKQPGKVDITKPEYDVMVEYKADEGELPTHGIHLWLGKENEKSTFMYITDDSVYLTSPQMTKELRKLILSEEYLLRIFIHIYNLSSFILILVQLETNPRSLVRDFSLLIPLRGLAQAFVVAI